MNSYSCCRQALLDWTGVQQMQKQWRWFFPGCKAYLNTCPKRISRTSIRLKEAATFFILSRGQRYIRGCSQHVLGTTYGHSFGEIGVNLVQRRPACLPTSNVLHNLMVRETRISQHVFGAHQDWSLLAPDTYNQQYVCKWVQSRTPAQTQQQSTCFSSGAIQCTGRSLLSSLTTFHSNGCPFSKTLDKRQQDGSCKYRTANTLSRTATDQS